MAEQKLEVVISADVTQLERGVKKAESSLKGFQKASANTGVTLTNLTRIASDAPFGFIAIQNNLDPLIQSFGQLKEQTKGTIPALKALIGSLAGPAGLAFGFSVVASTATYLIQKYGSLGKAFAALTGKQITEAQKAQQAIKKLFEEAKSVADIQFGAEGAGVAQQSRVEGLIKVFGDLNRSTKERKRALEELGEINKNYFGDLSFEKTTIQQLTDLSNEYTQSIINQAIIKSAQDEIGKLGLEFAKQKKAVTESRQALEAAQRPYDDYIKNNQNANKRVLVLDKNITELTNANRSSVLSFNTINSKISEYVELIKNASSELVKFKNTSTDKKDKPKEEDVLFVSPPKAQVFKSVDDTIRLIKDKIKIAKGVEVPFTGLNINSAIASFDKFAELQRNLYDNKKQAEYFAQWENFAMTVGQNLSNLFLAMAANGKNAFETLREAIGNMVKALAAAVIKAAVFAGIMALIPGGSLASGGKGFLEFFKQGLGFGGTNSIGGPNFGGMTGGGGNVTFKLAGSDLIGSLNRTNARVGRVG